MIGFNGLASQIYAAYFSLTIFVALIAAGVFFLTARILRQNNLKQNHKTLVYFFETVAVLVIYIGLMWPLIQSYLG